MDSEALRPYIDWYKAHFATIFDREGYKWKSIQTFQSYSAANNEYYSVLKEAFGSSRTSDFYCSGALALAVAIKVGRCP